MIGQDDGTDSEDQMAMIKMPKCIFLRTDRQYKQEMNSVGSQEGKLESKSTTTETKDSSTSTSLLVDQQNLKNESELRDYQLKKKKQSRKTEEKKNLTKVKR